MEDENDVQKNIGTYSLKEYDKISNQDNFDPDLLLQSLEELNFDKFINVENLQAIITELSTYLDQEVKAICEKIEKIIQKALDDKVESLNTSRKTKIDQAFKTTNAQLQQEVNNKNQEEQNLLNNTINSLQNEIQQQINSLQSSKQTEFNQKKNIITNQKTSETKDAIQILTYEIQSTTNNYNLVDKQAELDIGAENIIKQKQAEANATIESLRNAMNAELEIAGTAKDKVLNDRVQTLKEQKNTRIEQYQASRQAYHQNIIDQMQKREDEAFQQEVKKQNELFSKALVKKIESIQFLTKQKNELFYKNLNQLNLNTYKIEKQGLFQYFRDFVNSLIQNTNKLSKPSITINEIENYNISSDMVDFGQFIKHLASQQHFILKKNPLVFLNALLDKKYIPSKYCLEHLGTILKQHKFKDSIELQAITALNKTILNKVEIPEEITEIVADELNNKDHAENISIILINLSLLGQAFSKPVLEKLISIAKDQNYKSIVRKYCLEALFNNNSLHLDLLTKLVPLIDEPEFTSVTLNIFTKNINNLKNTSCNELLKILVSIISDENQNIIVRQQSLEIISAHNNLSSSHEIIEVIENCLNNNDLLDISVVILLKILAKGYNKSLSHKTISKLASIINNDGFNNLKLYVSSILLNDLEHNSYGNYDSEIIQNIINSLVSAQGNIKKNIIGVLKILFNTESVTYQFNINDLNILSDLLYSTIEDTRAVGFKIVAACAEQGIIKSTSVGQIIDLVDKDQLSSPIIVALNKIAECAYNNTNQEVIVTLKDIVTEISINKFINFALLQSHKIDDRLHALSFLNTLGKIFGNTLSQKLNIYQIEKLLSDNSIKIQQETIGLINHYFQYNKHLPDQLLNSLFKNTNLEVLSSGALDILMGLSDQPLPNEALKLLKWILLEHNDAGIREKAYKILIQYKFEVNNDLNEIIEIETSANRMLKNDQFLSNEIIQALEVFKNGKQITKNGFLALAKVINDSTNNDAIVLASEIIKENTSNLHNIPVEILQATVQKLKQKQHISILTKILKDIIQYSSYVTDNILELVDNLLKETEDKSEVLSIIKILVIRGKNLNIETIEYISNYALKNDLNKEILKDICDIFGHLKLKYEQPSHLMVEALFAMLKHSELLLKTLNALKKITSNNKIVLEENKAEKLKEILISADNSEVEKIITDILRQSELSEANAEIDQIILIDTLIDRLDPNNALEVLSQLVEILKNNNINYFSNKLVNKLQSYINIHEIQILCLEALSLMKVSDLSSDTIDKIFCLLSSPAAHQALILLDKIVEKYTFSEFQVAKLLENAFNSINQELSLKILKQINLNNEQINLLLLLELIVASPEINSQTLPIALAINILKALK